MSDSCAVPGLLEFEQAKNMLLDIVKPVIEIEDIAIEQAASRVMAKPVLATMAVPPHNNSAMDGYAFVWHMDLNSAVELDVVGHSFAGEPFNGDVGFGQCVRIMTGGKMPADCDTVVMQEHTQHDNGKLRIDTLPAKGRNVRLAGEDIAHGSQIFDSGHCLGPADIGLLASIGVASVSVYRPLKVALIATGDELKTPGSELKDGDIYETNRFVLKAMLNKLAVEVIDFGIVPDDKDALRQAFLQADQMADIVISSGGVSVGEADYTKDILAELGQIDFWKIAMKPGKPLAFGRLSDSVFFGLPGNPVSATITLYQLALAGIEKMQGKPQRQRAKFLATCLHDLKKSPGRMEFQRAVWMVNDDGDIVVDSTGSQGSGILSSISNANCFIILARQQGRISAGEKVWVEPFDSLLSC
ncbi:molybdopterin molybdotransferase MoeA [Thalassotalea sp. HSM 43]|uniref:molybdopterin molybdotransferase MoeA n=1 Tax=Thalassotalea sp. HSM 43 TaxID=2552945 RepID=UPI0010804FA2|nr:gephyrin-like molybdotransferase Glp [Thalassotalea sp. HSM 43]QBY03618.1 molybdopterin molybdotransferase MoeA [Thalassotalea sp. HSM 43]